MYKRVFIVLVTITSGLAVCSIAFILTLIWLSSSMCEVSTIYGTYYSPSHQQKVVVFERNCGATTGYSTQASIVDADQALANQPGNLFDIEGHPEWTQVTVKWLDEYHIVITYAPGHTLYKAKAQEWGIKVTYKRRID